MKYETEQERRASAARSIVAALRRLRTEPSINLGDPLALVRRKLPAAAGVPDAVLTAAAARAAGRAADPWLSVLEATPAAGRLPSPTDEAALVLLGEPTVEALRAMAARLRRRVPTLEPARPAAGRAQPARPMAPDSRSEALARFRSRDVVRAVMAARRRLESIERLNDRAVVQSVVDQYDRQPNRRRSHRA